MFSVEQTYTIESLTALCRTSRKKVRKIAGTVHTVGIVCAAALAVILVADILLFGSVDYIGVGFELLLAGLLLFEDRLNGIIALRQMLPGTAHSVTTFRDGDYFVQTDATETTYHYENITALCETDRYFFFFIGKKHGQIFEKEGFAPGTRDQFREWIEKKTGLRFENC